MVLAFQASVTWNLADESDSHFDPDLHFHLIWRLGRRKSLGREEYRNLDLGTRRIDVEGNLTVRSYRVSHDIPSLLTFNQAHVRRRAFSASSKMTPRLPKRAGKVYLSFSSAAEPRAVAVASSCLYDGCHGSISLGAGISVCHYIHLLGLHSLVTLL